MVGFENGEYVDLQGRAGGLVLWWKKEWDIQILRKSKYYIDVQINDSIVWHFTGIHISPIKQDKQAILAEIKGLVETLQEPWMIAEDFNLILTSDEKLSVALFPAEGGGVAELLNVSSET